MATWYVNASTGNDSTGDGTSSLPYQTLAKLVTVMGNGDTAYLTGTFRESATFSNLSNATFRKWTSDYVVRGDNVVTGWSSLGGGVYQKNIGASLNVKSVVVDWDTSLTADGLHYGHLDQGTFGSLSAGQWAYSTPNLQVRLSDSSDPVSKTVAWCRGGVNGLTLANATNCIVDDFNGALWVDSTAGSGYALIGYGTGNYFRIDRTDDCGYHHVGFVGGACANNTIEPSQGGEGVCAGNASGGIPLVFYTTSNSQTGNRGIGIRIYANPFIKTDGTTPSHAGTVGGCYSHTDGSRTFDGVTWENIRVSYPLTVAIGSSPLYAAHTTAPTAASLSRTDVSSYGVKFIWCTVDGVAAPGMIVGAQGSCVYDRCHLYFAATTKNQSPNAVITSASDSQRKQVLFNACEIMFNLDGASTGRGIKHWEHEDYLFVNTSVMDVGTGTNARLIFETSWISSTGANNDSCYYGRGSIFGFHSTTAATRYFMFGDSLNNNSANNNSVTPRDFYGCSYVRKTLMSTNVNFDAEGEWTASIEPTARYDSTSPWAQPTTNAQLSPSHPLWALRDISHSVHCLSGLNNKAWCGSYGPYQLPLGEGRSRHRVR